MYVCLRFSWLYAFLKPSIFFFFDKVGEPTSTFYEVMLARGMPSLLFVLFYLSCLCVYMCFCVYAYTRVPFFSFLFLSFFLSLHLFSNLLLLPPLSPLVAFLLIFENFIFLLKMFLAYLVPDVPKFVSELSLRRKDKKRRTEEEEEWWWWLWWWYLFSHCS